MTSEVINSWESLKSIADTLDSYRIRALLDAKQDILDAGVYNESQYYHILFTMFDQERVKYSLFEDIKNHPQKNYSAIQEFVEKNSIDLKKVLSILKLLMYENLIKIEELYDKRDNGDNIPENLIFKDFNISIIQKDISKIRSIYEPVKIIFDTKVCSGCSLCAGICPVKCLDIYNGFGKIDEDKCIRCGLCYLICPRSFLPVDILNMLQENTSEFKKYYKIGSYIEVYSARTKLKKIAEVCQDGGISSTLLYYLLEAGKIDLALGAKMSNTLWRPEPIIIKSKDDVLLTSGTKYVNNPTLKSLNELHQENKSLAIVGVPCMMQALLKAELYDIGFPALNNIKYRIGIFCMESFSYQSLLKICEVLETNIKHIKKMDINRGQFIVYTHKGDTLQVPIKQISHLAREDCEVCFDLTAESADISVGSIGSPSGWNTIILRTEKGKELYEELLKRDLIESKSITEIQPGLPMVEKIAGIKKTTCLKHINAKKDEEKRVPLY